MEACAHLVYPALPPFFHKPPPAGGRHSSVILTFALVASAGALLSGAPDPPVREDPLGSHVRTLAQLHGPRAVAIGWDGRVVVAETGAHRVRVFGRDGVELLAFGARGSAPGELLFPSGVAVTGTGVLFVADTGNHRVQVFDAAGGFVREWGGFGAADGRFHTPHGLAVRAGQVAVADERNGRVQVFDHEGRHLRSIGAGRLARPTDVAFDGEGRLFVTDQDLNRVVVFDAAGHFLREWGDWGWYQGLFSTPSGIAVANGSVFVADLENHRVQVFDRAGELEYKWGLHAIRPREGRGMLHYPAHLAVSPSGDLAALAEPFDDRVQLFGPRSATQDEEDQAWRRQGVGQPAPHYGPDMDAAGAYMTIVEPESRSILVYDMQWTEPRLVSRVGGYGSAMGLFLRPTGVFLGVDRTLVACDAGSRRLQVVRLRVDPADEVGQDAAMPAFVKMLDFDRLGRRLGAEVLEWSIEPVAVTRDAEGRFFVLDGRNERIFVFDEKLGYERSFGGHGTAPGRFRAPTGLRFSPAGDRLYVVDAHNRRIQAFAPDGTFQFAFGADAEGRALELPHGVAVGADGSVFVTDAGASRVVKYDADGRFRAAWGGPGIRRLEFQEPRSIAVDGRGQLIVLDHANHRIQWMTQAGEYLGSAGSRLYTKPARLPETYDPADYEE